MDVTGIDNIWQFLAAALTFFVPFIFKWISDNKKQKITNDKLDKITTDNKQDERIGNIENKLDELTSLFRDSKFLKLLKIKTYNIFTDLVQVKNLENTEIKNALFFGHEQFNKWIEGIIHNDFTLTDIQVKQNAYHLLKFISDKLNNKNAKISNVFVNNLKNFLINETENFTYKYRTFKRLENGVRRKELENNALSMFENIVKYTIDNYHTEITKVN